jgi:ribosomal protein S18 acetylase RimI-like enzyme
MTVRRARPDEWAVLRELRLRALADAPDAFASTLADEAAAPEEMWRRRADGGPDVVNLIAEARASRGSDDTSHRDGDAAAAGDGVGMATVRLEPDKGGRAHLLGMWVDPSFRGSGVAAALLDHAVGWARDKGATEMVLWVADHNTAARRLYERAGFVATGDRQPLPSNPALPESMLRRSLASD